MRFFTRKAPVHRGFSMEPRRIEDRYLDNIRVYKQGQLGTAQNNPFSALLFQPFDNLEAGLARSLFYFPQAELLIDCPMNYVLLSLPRPVPPTLSSS